MYEILLILYLLVAIALIALVLIQQGKGSEMGASFGSGASSTLFGASGSGNFLTRTTSVLAFFFVVISLVLTNMSGHAKKAESEWDNLSQPAVKQESVTKQVQVAQEKKAPETLPVKDSDVPVSTESKK
ncbi:preprotein translocase subunit SecG [Dongshaea marina]|uniref:preprotein translocase subunit SecG n=1 Tax=Dongshaea marina TaxID=2047966 RepID=UPI000D3EA027|nr:preprotein translocase subunit SecG [Dongshaea marina]